MHRLDLSNELAPISVLHPHEPAPHIARWASRPKPHSPWQVVLSQ